MNWLEAKIWVYTIFILGGFVGLHIVWPSIMAVLVLIWRALITLDILLGWYIALRNKRFTSARMLDWLLKKTWLMATLLVVFLAIYHMAYLFKEYATFLGAIPIGGMFLYVITELASVLENIWELQWNKYESRFVNFLRKVVWLTMDKSYKYVNDKINDIAKDTNNQGDPQRD